MFDSGPSIELRHRCLDTGSESVYVFKGIGILVSSPLGNAYIFLLVAVIIEFFAFGYRALLKLGAITASMDRESSNE